MDSLDSEERVEDSLDDEEWVPSVDCDCLVESVNGGEYEEDLLDGDGCVDDSLDSVDKLVGWEDVDVQIEYSLDDVGSLVVMECSVE